MKKWMNKALFARFVCRRFITRFSTYVTMLLKFVTTLAVVITVNRLFPFRHILTRPAVELAIALLGSILPWSYLSFFGGVVLLGQLSGASLESTVFLAVLVLVLAVIKYLMLPGGSGVSAILPLLCHFHLPYAMPLAIGLYGGFSGFVSVSSGMVIYYNIKFIYDNLTYLTDKAGSTVINRFLFLAEGFLGNEEMLIAVATFSLTTLIVYLVSRQDIRYAHGVALVVGTVFCPVLYGVWMSYAGLEGGLGGLVWGSILGLIVMLSYDFYREALDYDKTEKVQFEDDDYYYYVKAVPKIRLPEELAEIREEAAPLTKATIPLQKAQLGPRKDSENE